MRKPPYLFVDHPLREGAEIPLTPGQFHYLARVMRLESQGQVYIFNGKDGLWEAHLHLINRRQGYLQCVYLQALQEGTPGAKVYLGFSLIKRWEWLVAKGTELGVSGFFPIISQYSQLSKIEADRALSIIQEACEQNQRLSLPQWHNPRPLKLCFEACKEDPWHHVVWDLGQPSWQNKAWETKQAQLLWIGPEGGWSSEERGFWQDLKAAPPPGQRISLVSLGDRPLRAETAGVAACTLARWGMSSF